MRFHLTFLDSVSGLQCFYVCGDHNIGLLAVSSRDEDPINKFVDLFNINQLPSLLNDGSMDPKMLKHFVLVHDGVEVPLERFDALSF